MNKLKSQIITLTLSFTTLLSTTKNVFADLLPVDFDEPEKTVGISVVSEPVQESFLQSQYIIIGIVIIIVIIIALITLSKMKKK